MKIEKVNPGKDKSRPGELKTDIKKMEFKNSISLTGVKKLNIPKKPGSYQFKNKAGKIIYIGKAGNLRSRIFSYFQKGAAHSSLKQALLKEINRIEWIETDSEIEALLLEANLIKKYQPNFNVLMRDDKRYAYIKVSTEDEIPGVFITRKIEKTGKYFGPFTNTTAMRETIKAVRKIWPYCTERKIKKKLCFYAQIGRCRGVCGGEYGIAEYKEKVIKPIILFLQGKKRRIIKNYELKIKNLSVRSGSDFGREKELNNLKYQLLNMKNVLEHANILSISEKYAADVMELAKELALPRVPRRIEGYDISNIFGREAVGVMVVFRGGEPDKKEYRKFKIRVGEGEANDTGMLREVLQRRLRYLTDNRPAVAKAMAGKQQIADNSFRKIPDLIIIDGGKGQLNAAVRVLKKIKLDIPIIAVSKGRGLRSSRAPDKIFFPGEKKSLELPLASPALHIIKRVRDEAHRFAISYHKLLRKKRMLK